MNILNFLYGQVSNSLNKNAMIYLKKDGSQENFTYEEIFHNADKAANILKHYEVIAKDRVAICMDRSPYTIFFFLGSLKIGAICSLIFSTFGTESIKERLNDCKASIIITTPVYKDKIMRIKDEIPSLKHIIVLDDTMISKLGTYDNVCNSNECDDSAYALIQYTSGTTGRPKGAVHSHGIAQEIAISAKEILKLKSEDVYWCTADYAWITGISYGIIAPMSAGCTIIIADPPNKLKQVMGIIEKYKVNKWFTAPTLLRMFMRENVDVLELPDVSSLQSIFTVGETLNPAIVEWGRRVFGKDIYDTWFQTELCAIAIANIDEYGIKLGSMGKPVSGIETEILDDDYNVMKAVGKVGHLGIKTQKSTLMRTFWGNEEKYLDKFKNGWYITGDLAEKDSDGYIWFSSRADEVLNIAGHLVSPLEIEGALNDHPKISEVAACGIVDQVMGEVAKVCIVLKDGVTADANFDFEIRQIVRERISSFAVPQKIEIVDSIPKTNSGKIIRRLL